MQLRLDKPGGEGMKTARGKEEAAGLRKGQVGDKPAPAQGRSMRIHRML